MFYLPNEILGKDFFVQRMCANEFRLLPIGVVECNAHDDRLDLVVVAGGRVKLSRGQSGLAVILPNDLDFLEKKMS